MTLDIEAAARSLIERGYAVLRDDGVLMSRAREVFQEGQAFFEQSDEAKLGAATPSRLEGYRPLGSEYSEKTDYPDLCESFSVWPWNQAEPEVRSWAGENKLHAAISSALRDYASVANRVLEALRCRLSPQSERIDATDASYLQVNYYRPTDFAREFLQEVHEDGHVLTIHKSTGRGLEIKSLGQFVTLDIANDEFLLLPGSLLSLLTGSAIAPLFHRVRNDHRSARRQSLLYFINPSLTEETRPWIENDSNRGVSIRSVAASCIGAR